MPVYCRCNGRGRCIACSCVKSGSRCVSCLPSRNGHCSNYECTIDATSNDEHSRTLLPLPMQLSNTLDTTPEAITENALDDGPDFVGAMLDNASAEPGLGAASDGDQALNYSLPFFRPVQGAGYMWGGLSGHVFSSLIDDAYSQIVHWRSHLFKVPSRSTGKRFMAEIARLFEAFAIESALEAVALKAAMTLPALLLQKPHAKSKVQEHIACLKRRLLLWDKGDIEELLKEGRVIQRSMRRSKLARNPNDDAKMAHKFFNLMMEGEDRAALQLLTKETESGPLKLSDVADDSEKIVRGILMDKHPPPEPPYPDVL